MGFDAESVRELVLRLPVVLFSLTIHEVMHAWVALKCGDDTALRAGRITLNPLVHLDPIGTLCLMFAPIGWAKPVPVNPSNYGQPRRDDILVSGAGIAANFAMGIGFAFIMRFFGAALYGISEVGPILFNVLFLGCVVNFGLAVFNLLPFPPLDGSHILQNLLPLNLAIRFAELRRYGIIMVIAFVMLNRFAAQALGFSLLGYPIRKLIELFSGLDLG
ncbi:MAG TPA: site-2 protease family protein [Phycisphaerae bacterium]|nr:site-2 protease family protein [Phycisphaerae bacterium]